MGGAARLGPLEHVATLTRQRAETLRRQRSRKWTPGSGQPFVLLVVDELADVIAYQPDNGLRKRANLALQSILSQGRALAIGWDEIDLDEATVDVCWRLVRRKGVGLLRLPSTKSGESGERLIPLPSWAVTMLKRRRLAIASEVQAVFPDSLGGWRDPSNVRRVW